MEHNSGRTVLIVDDEPDIVEYLSTLLRDNGFLTATAANGKEGMEAARSGHPALILLDISMPEQSGVRLFRDLQEDPQTCDIPVVIVTGVSHEFKRFIETRRQVHPPAGYFDKPPNPAELLAKINEILAPKRAA